MELLLVLIYIQVNLIVWLLLELRERFRMLTLIIGSKIFIPRIQKVYMLLGRVVVCCAKGCGPLLMINCCCMWHFAFVFDSFCSFFQMCQVSSAENQQQITPSSHNQHPGLGADAKNGHQKLQTNGSRMINWTDGSFSNLLFDFFLLFLRSFDMSGSTFDDLYGKVHNEEWKRMSKRRFQKFSCWKSTLWIGIYCVPLEYLETCQESFESLFFCFCVVFGVFFWQTHGKCRLREICFVQDPSSKQPDFIEIYKYYCERLPAEIPANAFFLKPRCKWFIVCCFFCVFFVLIFVVFCRMVMTLWDFAKYRLVQTHFLSILKEFGNYLVLSFVDVLVTYDIVWSRPIMIRASISRD